MQKATNPNTGLEYLRARYYNAEEGRFFQEDTYLGDITDPLTLNRYAYVKNSPLNYVDPSGHEPIGEEFLKPQKPSSEEIAEETGLNDWLIDMMLKLETSMQKRELEKNMREAQKKAEVDKCGTAILTDKLFSFMISLIYGGIAAVLDNEMAMVTLPAGMAGKDTLVDMFRENAANELAYNIGALIGDIFSIIEGLSKVISGITGAAAGAALAAQSGGATITVSGSGLALAANGMLITISGASNAAKIMISEATSHGGGKNEGDSKTENPQDYLDEALERQGLDKTPKRLKEKWTDGEYNYEVRVHEGNDKYTDADSIYRVSRQKVPDPNPKVQGSGKEYLGSDGKWYHESELIEFNKNGISNPLYNEHGAKVTHIPVD